MNYSYVWITIAVSQAVMVGAIGILEYVRRARLSESAGVDAADAAGSRWWWRRLAAARQLASVAGPEYQGVIRRLLLDSHPGVQSAATACLRRYADKELLALVIDSVSQRSTAVQRYQADVLRERSDLTVPLLLERIQPDTPPSTLKSYIQLAEAIGVGACFEQVAALSTHQDPAVRVAVARLIQHVDGESAIVKLVTMLRDPDWRVRAQAARGLGRKRDDLVVQELGRALTDQAWWVRFRAGLALAGLGDAGRKALEGARSLPDRYARDMAAFVLGLSESSILELSEG